MPHPEIMKLDPDRRTLWLASASPRRRWLLDDAGYAFRVRAADLDDGVLASDDRQPATWTTALAYLKARRVADLLRADGTQGGLVLGADTVCALGTAILGQPRDADDARRMLETLRDARHETTTGVCVIDLDDDERLLFHDTVVVTVGPVGDAELDAYIRSDAWVGKAGGYNLADRVADGWPIHWDGDPATVMGLPMRLLERLFRGGAS